MSQQDEHAHHGEVTDRELSEILAAHQKWIDTDGAEGERADLSNVVDLMGGRLAGANLAGAKMPPQLKRFRELIHVDQTVAIARPLFLVMLLLCAYTVIAVFSTNDISIITNKPIQLFPDSALGIPVAGFIIIVPILLFGIYIYLHLYLYRLWQILGGLPAVFHDGTTIEQAISPWLVTAFVRFYQKFGVLKPSLLGVSQRRVTAFLVWWLSPITLVSIWGKYLVRHDWTGTILHIVLVALAIWSALILRSFAIAGLRNEARPLQDHRGIALSVILLLGIGIGIFMLSFGAIEGTRKEISIYDWRTWVPQAFQIVGLQTCANMERARLFDVDLSDRDLRCANLSGASLQGINLRLADLRGAELTGADLTGADLSYARLDYANLWKAGLVKAKLSNSKLVGAILNDANLENADLRAAVLRGARLNSANLVRVDFSNANLESAELGGAELEKANLRGANLTNSDLGLARLVEANLFSANFHGSDLTGTRFDSADFSKVKGLTQEQLDNACGKYVRDLPAGLKIGPCPEDQNDLSY